MTTRRTSRAGVRVDHGARRSASDQRINEVGNRTSRRFGEFDELDTRSVAHLLATKLPDRGMDDAALDDDGMVPQRQAKIVQRPRPEVLRSCRSVLR